MFIDVQKDPAKLNEMLDLTGGKRTVPVIVEDGRLKHGPGGGG